jgi:hypothetical protein
MLNEPLPPPMYKGQHLHGTLPPASLACKLLAAGAAEPLHTIPHSPLLPCPSRRRQLGDGQQAVPAQRRLQDRSHRGQRIRVHQRGHRGQAQVGLRGWRPACGHPRLACLARLRGLAERGHRPGAPAWPRAYHALHRPTLAGRRWARMWATASPSSSTPSRAAPPRRTSASTCTSPTSRATATWARRTCGARHSAQRLPRRLAAPHARRRCTPPARPRPAPCTDRAPLPPPRAPGASPAAPATPRCWTPTTRTRTRRRTCCAWRPRSRRRAPSPSPSPRPATTRTRSTR